VTNNGVKVALERLDDCRRLIWDIGDLRNLIVRVVFGIFGNLGRRGGWMVVLGGLGTLRFFETVDVGLNVRARFGTLRG
jgi:hypothetical protein